MLQWSARSSRRLGEHVLACHGAFSPRRSRHDWARLSRFWAPQADIVKLKSWKGNANEWLVGTGFIHQTQSGIYHMLPLGLRVQQKIEALLDHEMESLDASKVALSSLSSKDLWRASRRLDGGNKERFSVEDRHGSQFFLAPTHEEEITALVAYGVRSYKSLPLRLYQITRKYRDELRPRQGLLRAREFLMKDLYTFDVDESAARTTYDAVRHVYRRFFALLRIPVKEAKADSGSMGGDLSHEFHILSPDGEDQLFVCPACDYTINSECLPSTAGEDQKQTCPNCTTEQHLPAMTSIELGHTFLLGRRYSSKLQAQVSQPVRQAENEQMVSPLASELQPVEMGCYGIGVSRLMAAMASVLLDDRGLNWPRAIAPFEVVIVPGPGVGQTDINQVATILTAETGSGSSLSESSVPSTQGLPQQSTPIEEPASVQNLGSHKPSHSSAPAGNINHMPPASASSPGRLDVVVDDRDLRVLSKLFQSDRRGYPVIVVLGRAWHAGRRCEVQCRRLQVKEDVPLESLRAFVGKLLDQL